MRWIIVLLLWCFLLRLYSLIFHHFNVKNIPPLCFPTSFISSFNVSFISILISLLFNLTTEIFLNSVGSSVTFRRRSEWVQLIDLFLDSDSHFIIKYHLQWTFKLTTVIIIYWLWMQNNWTKSWNLITFYALKALWDGQGKMKIYYGMSSVKKQLSGKRYIAKTFKIRNIEIRGHSINNYVTVKSTKSTSLPPYSAP